MAIFIFDSNFVQDTSKNIFVDRIKLCFLRVFSNQAKLNDRGSFLNWSDELKNCLQHLMIFELAAEMHYRGVYVHSISRMAVTVKPVLDAFTSSTIVVLEITFRSDAEGISTHFARIVFKIPYSIKYDLSSSWKPLVKIAQSLQEDARTQG